MTNSVQLSPGELRSPVGLIAGNGTFPIEFAEEARKRSISVVAVAHLGETDPRLESIVSQCTWIKVGQLGKLLRILRKAGVQQAAFAGGIKKIRLFGGVALDWRGVRFLARIKSTKDDVLLRGLAGEVEREGITVISASVLLDKSVPHLGTLTHRALTPEERSDARIGWEAARAIGALDIGQTVVVSKGVVVAVEAVEGTDAALQRAGELAGAGCTVVKLAKPQQDLRLDLPAIGIDTIRRLGNMGARALIVEAERALLLDPDAVIREANRLGISITAAHALSDLE